MAKQTSRLIRRAYKGTLLAGLAIVAFILKFQNETPEPTAFEMLNINQASADVVSPGDGASDSGADCPSGSPSSDCDGDGPDGE